MALKCFHPLKVGVSGFLFFSYVYLAGCVSCAKCSERSVYNSDICGNWKCIKIVINVGAWKIKKNIDFVRLFLLVTLYKEIKKIEVSFLI